MRRISGALLILLIICQGVCAQSKDPNYPADPNELVRTKWRAVISVLRTKDIDQDVKEKKISKIVTPMFDFPLMAKLALGREH